MAEGQCPKIHCTCRGEGRRATEPPIRIYSSFAAFIRRAAPKLTGTAEIGTWRCRYCGVVHTLTASMLRLASS